MRSLRLIALGFVLAASLSACSGASTATPTQSGIPKQTIDPSLIPAAAPADAKMVDPIIFDGGYHEFTFKVGDGPVWCTINDQDNFVLCEQNEATAAYAPIATPDTCNYSYGYQFRMRQDSFSGQPFVDLPCSGGAYADPTGANKLNDHEQIKINNITCWVDKLTARCDNARGNYIALGPEVWAVH